MIKYLLVFLLVFASTQAFAEKFDVWIYEAITVDISVDSVDLLSARVLDDKYITTNGIQSFGINLYKPLKILYSLDVHDFDLEMLLDKDLNVDGNPFLMAESREVLLHLDEKNIWFLIEYYSQIGSIRIAKLKPINSGLLVRSEPMVSVKLSSDYDQKMNELTQVIQKTFKKD